MNGAVGNLYANMTHVVRGASGEELETILTVLANECDRRATRREPGEWIRQARDYFALHRLQA